LWTGVSYNTKAIVLKREQQEKEKGKGCYHPSSIKKQTGQKKKRRRRFFKVGKICIKIFFYAGKITRWKKKARSIKCRPEQSDKWMEREKIFWLEV